MITLPTVHFQIPNMAKEDRWLNRIVSNLLYYQTNYFVSALVIFALVSFAHPQHMVYGMSVMVRRALIY